MEASSGDDKNTQNSNPQLQLVPLVVPCNQGRFLPLDLGRVELVTWWLNSCCRRLGKRHRLCQSCLSLVTNSKFLSKSMLQLDTSRLMHVTGKNSKCMFLNNRPIGSRGKTVQDGDVLSFRSDLDSPVWMSFQFRRRTPSFVTPEAARNFSAVTNRPFTKDYDGETSARHTKNTEHDSISSFMKKRKRPKRDKEPPRSRRRLFAETMKQDLAPLTQQQEVFTSLTSSEDTAKRGTFGTQLQASQECSLLSLPHFSSSESYDSDDPRIKQHAEPRCKATSDTVSSPASRESLVSPQWQLASDLNLCQWKAVKESPSTASRVRRALVKLVVAGNSSRREGDTYTWLPKLLQGTLISKQET